MKISFYDALILSAFSIIEVWTATTRGPSVYPYCGAYNKDHYDKIGCPRKENYYYPRVYSPLNLLLRYRTWILTAAGSSAADAPPPARTCVNVTITDTGRVSDCIFNTFNHTIRKTPIVSVIGRDEENNLEINSVGPIFEYPFIKLLPGMFDDPKFMYQNSFVRSTACWNPKNYKFYSYWFFVKNPYLWWITVNNQHRTQYLYLVGINARMPAPEYHVALLAMRKEAIFDVQAAIDSVSHPLVQLDDPRQGGTIGYFPNMTIKCATDYDYKSTPAGR